MTRDCGGSIYGFLFWIIIIFCESGPVETRFFRAILLSLLPGHWLLILQMVLTSGWRVGSSISRRRWEFR